MRLPYRLSFCQMNARWINLIARDCGYSHFNYQPRVSRRVSPTVVSYDVTIP